MKSALQGAAKKDCQCHSEGCRNSRTNNMFEALQEDDDEEEMAEQERKANETEYLTTRMK